MDDRKDGSVPDSLRYTDGNYVAERGRWLTGGDSVRGRRVAARMLRAVHKPWFRVWLPHGVGVLTTTGRKTGKPRTTYIKAVRAGDKAYLVAIPGQQALWLKNIRADSSVRLRVRGGTFAGVAREPHDDSERRTAYDAFCGTVHPFDYVENAFHRRGLPTRAKIVELHRAWFDGGIPLVVDLEKDAGTLES
ncbi:nitroreductase family deazaflavin-dependent oxidoreductase [Antrihabitans spumae]|uniref:Nitroreductase family deazaflavin-dependent oxidoreductase n=1 Tax=Antrihabitans spumae TaxID=3373370 RepID=A0ABW7JWR3_9NOCA